MENKNHTFIYQKRTFDIKFTNTNFKFTIEDVNYIKNTLKLIDENLQYNVKHNEIKIILSCELTYNTLKSKILTLTRELYKKNNNKPYINFNIENSNNFISNIYTMINIDDDQHMIEDKILSLKKHFVNNIFNKQEKEEISIEKINSWIFSIMYNINYKKAIFTIDINLYELLIKILCISNDINLDNMQNIENYNLFTFEINDNIYNFKEYLNICKNCKQYHKTYYENSYDLNNCTFICANCTYTSKQRCYKEHVCNQKDKKDNCHLCEFYHDIFKKHLPNRGECYHHNNIINTFIIKNRSETIKKLNNLLIKHSSNKKTKNEETSIPNVTSYSSICKLTCTNNIKKNNNDKFTQTQNISLDKNIQTDNIENINNSDINTESFDLSEMFNTFIENCDKKKENNLIDYKKIIKKDKIYNNFIFTFPCNINEDTDIYNFIINFKNKKISLKI